MDRYKNLFSALDEIAARQSTLRIMEVGTYDGIRAASLLRHWQLKHPENAAAYFGFDLFEDLTPEKSKAELSKSKLPPPLGAVLKRLEATGATIKLTKGDTCKTLPAAAANVDDIGPMDLVFLDGGHSLETIASDWKAVSRFMVRGSIALLDDYYENREDFGCQKEVRRIAMEVNSKKEQRWRVGILDPVDHVEHNGLYIRMVRIELWS